MEALGILRCPVFITGLMAIEANKVESYCIRSIGDLLAIFLFRVEEAGFRIRVDFEDMRANVSRKLTGFDCRLGSPWHMALNTTDVAHAVNGLGVCCGLTVMAFSTFLFSQDGALMRVVALRAA